MKKLTGILLILLGLPVLVCAGSVIAPEISPDAGVSAVALLSGGLLILRARRSR